MKSFGIFSFFFLPPFTAIIEQRAFVIFFFSSSLLLMKRMKNSFSVRSRVLEKEKTQLELWRMFRRSQGENGSMDAINLAYGFCWDALGMSTYTNWIQWQSSNWLSIRGCSLKMSYFHKKGVQKISFLKTNAG